MDPPRERKPYKSTGGIKRQVYVSTHQVQASVSSTLMLLTSAWHMACVQSQRGADLIQSKMMMMWGLMSSDVGLTLFSPK